MTRSGLVAAVASSLLLLAFVVAFLPSVAGPDELSVDQALSRYARYGADVWARNPGALISGEGSACISCHTSLPYALVEPLLPKSYAAYDDLIDNVNDRVLTWQENTPWYSDKKLEKTAALSNMPPEVLKDLLDAEDSRGVEAIFNAFIRAMHDAYSDLPAEPETQQAFENMWSKQIQKGHLAGRWRWIKAKLGPWEVADSDLWGASLACIAASRFPELAPEANLELLNAALRQAASDDDVSLHVKSAILWCDAETGGSVMQGDAAKQIASKLLKLQRENGGCALRDLGPWSARKSKGRWTTRWLGSRGNWQTRIPQNPDTTGTIAPTRICPNSGIASIPMRGTCGRTWQERFTSSRQHLGSTNSREHVRDGHARSSSRQRGIDLEGRNERQRPAS